MTAPDLHHHGDAEATPGLLDLAVNVRLPGPPAWLRQALTGALGGLGRYPDPRPAVEAVAARHDRARDEVLLTAGGAEAFVLLARALHARRPVCVHPSFTEPEAALLAAGHPVERVVLPPPYLLRPDLVPGDADLVVLGNPTNPTGVLHDRDAVLGLRRPGRVLVVDEAFMDAVPGERDSLAGSSLPDVVVVRSLTKTWGLAGLRVGYLLGPAPLVARLAAAQPLWPVSTPALVALERCSGPGALAEAREAAAATQAHRRHLLDGLAARGIAAVAPSQAPFVLVRARDGSGLRRRLRELGVAVRRGDTFPGLDADHLRVAVREPAVTDLLLAALDVALTGPPGSSGAAGVLEAAVSGTVAAGGASERGGVTLVGGGPGDPDLLTVGGLRALQEADVVVADRLGPTAVLDALPPGVEIVDVGKTPRGPAATQEDINALLVARARAGQRVVRLKGGDPFVFGRGGEEVQACAAAGVPVRVLPGVSSAVAAPALAGIPLTHRGLTQHVVVASGHVPPGDQRSTVDWAALARAGGTLVLLMAAENRGPIAAALVAGGMDPDTPAAVVQSASLPGQRVHRTDLGRLAGTPASPPAVIVVGAVAALG